MKKLLIAALALVAGCSRCGGPARQVKQLEQEAADKRAATAVRLKAASVAELARALEVQSVKGKEPFNSPDFQELTGRGAAAGAELVPLLSKGAPDSFLGLLALRQIDPARYGALDPAFRVGVLIDTLRGARTFNAFGLPQSTRELAAQAIVQEGKSALPALSSLLGDKRPAPLWGSEDYMEWKRYQYRVCDYALAFSSEIRGERLVLPVDPVERDKLIARLAPAQPPK